MRARGVEDERPRVATLRERSRVADDDNLIFEVGNGAVVVDVAVEAGIGNRAERETCSSAMLDDGLAEERRDGQPIWLATRYFNEVEAVRVSLPRSIHTGTQEEAKDWVHFFSKRRMIQESLQ